MQQYGEAAGIQRRVDGQELQNKTAELEKQLEKLGKKSAPEKPDAEPPKPAEDKPAGR